MKVKFATGLLVIVIVSILACGVSGICGADEGKGVSGKTETLIKVNNTVCPVMGNKVDMSNPITVDYKGKVYNLCCPACVAEFKRNPEKYSAKAEAKTN